MCQALYKLSAYDYLRGRMEEPDISWIHLVTP